MYSKKVVFFVFLFLIFFSLISALSSSESHVSISGRVISSVPENPTSLQSSCNAECTQCTLKWGSVANADSYLLRVDFISNDNRLCSDGWLCPNSPDLVADFVEENFYVAPVQANEPYTWWVHSYNSAGVSGAVGASFNCHVEAPVALLSQSSEQTISGDSFKIVWSSSGSSSCVLSKAINGGASSVLATGLSGTWDASPTVLGTHIFKVTCSNSNGQSNSSSVNHVVFGKSIPLPTVAISQSSEQTISGAKFIVTWSSSNASSCTLSKAINGGASSVLATGLSGTWDASPTVLGTHIFKVTCSNSNGQSNSSSVSHTVTSAPNNSVINSSSCQNRCSNIYKYCMAINIKNYPSCDVADYIYNSSCIEGSIVGKCNSENLTCTDSDGGLNYYSKGKVISSFDGKVLEDNCSSTTQLIEHLCQADGSASIFPYVISCSSGCINGACNQGGTSESSGGELFQIKSVSSNSDARITERCEGCLLNSKCVAYGYRTLRQYCSSSGKLLIQTENRYSCINNFECRSNLCISGLCSDQSVLRRVLNWWSNTRS